MCIDPRYNIDAPFACLSSQCTIPPDLGGDSPRLVFVYIPGHKADFNGATPNSHLRLGTRVWIRFGPDSVALSRDPEVPDMARRICRAES